MRLICCDPGVHGCAAFYDGKTIQLIEYPTFIVESRKKKLDKIVVTKNTRYDIPALAKIIRELEPDTALIEEVSSRPRDGVRQSFLFGRGFGLLEGMLSMASCELSYVRPAIWKKAVGLATGSTKNDSRLLAIELFPELSDNMKLKKNENIAEALLLLYFYLYKRKVKK